MATRKLAHIQSKKWASQLVWQSTCHPHHQRYWAPPVWSSNCRLCSASHWKLNSMNRRYPLRHQTCRAFYIGTNFLSIPIKSNCKNPGDVMIRTWMKKKAVFTTIVDLLWSKSVDEVKSQVNQNKKMLWEESCCHWLITWFLLAERGEFVFFWDMSCYSKWTRRICISSSLQQSFGQR